jgi:hypothetical protein
MQINSTFNFTKMRYGNLFHYHTTLNKPIPHNLGSVSVLERYGKVTENRSAFAQQMYGRFQVESDIPPCSLNKLLSVYGCMFISSVTRWVNHVSQRIQVNWTFQ